MAGTVGALAPSGALACPVCFASTSPHLLHTYYLSAIFLTLMPLLLIGAFAGIVARRRRRDRRNAAPSGARASLAEGRTGAGGPLHAAPDVGRP